MWKSASKLPAVSTSLVIILPFVSHVPPIPVHPTLCPLPAQTHVFVRVYKGNKEIKNTHDRRNAQQKETVKGSLATLC